MTPRTFLHDDRCRVCRAGRRAHRRQLLETYSPLAAVVALFVVGAVLSALLGGSS